MPANPRLRPLDFAPVHYQGQPMLLLRDPLQLTDSQLCLPPALVQLLPFCDGSRTIQEIHRAFCHYFEVLIPIKMVTDTIAQLDEACLLLNERSERARWQRLIEYRAQGYRPPALAGANYPAQADQLRAHLAAFGKNDHEPIKKWRGRGIVSPHIDYQRGGEVYAKVWRRAEAAVKEADIVLIFGTDHHGGELVTLTQTAYATPYGILPIDGELVAKLANALGSTAFASELHHRQEHAIELSAVWLHHTLGKQASYPVIPILCGSFQPFVSNGTHPRQNKALNRFIETLQAETEGKKVLAVASVDLAHVGPNFGDRYTMNRARRVALKRSDKSLMRAIAAGDADRFYHEIARVQDRNKICGFSSIYLMLRYLQNHSGQEIAYQHCSADEQDNSLVSICGMLLD